MLYKIKSVQDIRTLPLSLPQHTRDELLRSTAILEYEYGPIHDDADGGYSVIIQTPGDLITLKSFVDYINHPPEWAMRMDDYAVAMYLINNEFTITAYVPLSIAPKEILNELEEKSK